jgi:hypothetical protein
VPRSSKSGFARASELISLSGLVEVRYGSGKHVEVVTADETFQSLRASTLAGHVVHRQALINLLVSLFQHSRL